MPISLAILVGVFPQAGGASFTLSTFRSLILKDRTDGKLLPQQDPLEDSE